ncbi:MAG: hypothetical protein A2836_00325 [Candidatus Taylorbacteria bacterium RIFCSPHIGHO2_01_FULL_45_63]|uniref:Uncharacterized protein n=1 Tax=Candidatus Taylorbacteria bacterium RIFCSPHIGHO2_02_FULL_45_35 TaxID=1802311 RepID=A0A1G2MXX9_9BACT|nr:MAG: hypothetical protein A2836_00325 [Candidatus Taylorbacteria bacterium RIFCSPHIGHO2_01_FULL_45_63]OHA27872.1 MAG: hypothetical protein A3D56_01495 [Candidatus Taylorbacteria bacterium RIFCSPHIGHO2_02_FULL_45_35]OHA32434.1 MAG: hypothetical protein A3A22_01060 [Candidatus Taylorbacteria bacterium RIFCSPLOWO2_01_FULL_45_34b]
MDELKAWGETYKFEIYPAAGCTHCPGCNDFSVADLFKWVRGSWTESIVGFSRETTYNDSSECAGIIIFECPKCGQKFCNHVGFTTVTKFLSKLPNWGKAKI